MEFLTKMDTGNAGSKGKNVKVSSRTWGASLDSVKNEHTRTKQRNMQLVTNVDFRSQA